MMLSVAPSQRVFEMDISSANCIANKKTYPHCPYKDPEIIPELVKLRLFHQFYKILEATIIGVLYIHI